MDKLEIHASICDSIKDLYRRKNADYGDSFGKARKAVPNYTLGKLYDMLLHRRSEERRVGKECRL